MSPSAPAVRWWGPLDDPYAATQSRCSVKNSPGNPLIVEWPAADRGSLEVRLRRGLVVVRYEGCEIEVLRHCKIPGLDYDYGGFTRKAEAPPEGCGALLRLELVPVGA